MTTRQAGLFELAGARPAAAAGMRRHFYRCPDCLSVVADDSPGGSPVARIDCGACAVALEWMGVVSQSWRGARLTVTDVVPHCDERCNCATGPKCECACGGEFHGAGLLVVVRDVGPVPVARVPNLARARAEGAVWRAAKADARERIEARYPELRAKARGEWVESFGRLMDGRAQLERLRAIVGQRGPTRARALARFVAQLEKGGN